MSKEKSTTLCHCCHQPMTIDGLQERPGNKPPHVVITCWNTDCGLYAVTSTEAGYPELDMSKYLKGSK